MLVPLRIIELRIIYVSWAHSASLLKNTEKNGGEKMNKANIWVMANTDIPDWKWRC